MYKLIALDMDGTLLNSDKKLTERVKTAITSAKNKGVHVVLASGRPTEGMMPYLIELGLDTDKDFILSYNASLILKVASKEVISRAILKGSDVKELYKVAQNLNVNIHAFSTDKGLITPKNSEYTQVEATLNDIDFSLFDFNDIDDNEDILKVMMIDAEDHLSKVIEQLPAYLQDKYSCARSTPFFYEFMNPKSHKGYGMAALCKHLNLSSDQVICIGDGGNDKEMIEFAGLGIAMENATDEVKAIAQVITSSNDDDGVAKAIEKYILNS